MASPDFLTGKPRDAETGLDDFGARYLSSQWGRWMSADWTAGASAVPYATLTNPQSLNLYAYVGNDPVDGMDADGHARYDNQGATGCAAYVSSCSTGGDYSDWASMALVDEQIYGHDLAATGGQYAMSAPNGGSYVGQTPASVITAVAMAQQQGNARTREFSTTNGSVSVTDGKAAYSAAVDYLRTDPTMKGVVDKFEAGSMPVAFINDGNDRVEGGKLYWDPHSALTTTSGGTQSPALGLGHEMTHGTGRWLGTIIRSMMPDPHYDNLEERRVIERFETPAARHLGEGVRTDHSCGTPCTFYVPSPTQH